MNRRGFLATLAAVPVAGLAGLGLVRRSPTFYGMTATEVVELINQSYRDAMIYGTSVVKIDWLGDPDIRFVGTGYRRPDPWRAILGRDRHP